MGEAEVHLLTPLLLEGVGDPPVAQGVEDSVRLPPIEAEGRPLPLLLPLAVRAREEETPSRGLGVEVSVDPPPRLSIVVVKEGEEEG
jgi:hypothetical protein